MPKRLVWSLLLLTLLFLAACGGGEEPAPTPTPLATFTPTAAPTARPSATATEAGAPTPEAAATPEATATVAAAATVMATSTVAGEETVAAAVTVTAAVTVETTATVELTAAVTPVAAAGDGFNSPLTAPDSPLPPPALDATPPALRKPVTGSWQLQTFRPSSSATAIDAPAGYRVAFGPTGVVRVMGDCKAGRGSYNSVSDGTLTIDITYADVRCTPESLADPFARALNNVTSYRFEGDHLVLAYGAQGGEMGLARTAQMASFGAPFLSWSNLQNSTFLAPDVPAGDNQAPLVDGEFRARLAANVTPAAAEAEAATTPVPPAGEFVISLATMHTYGVLVTPSPEEIAADPEITAEVSADTVVVLVMEDGTAGAAPRSYLAPVLNGGGLPLPLPLELLGDNAMVRDLRWDGTLLTVDYDQESAAMRRVYRFDSDHFVLENEERLPSRSPKARLDLPAQAVTLGPTGEASTPPGAGQAIMTGAIAAGEVHPYRLALEAGQQLSVTVQSPYDNVWLSIFGSEDRIVLRSIRSDTMRWTGNVPSTQEYLISAVAPGSSSPYALTIEVTNGDAADGSAAGAAPATAPAATPTTGGNIVHLAIDRVATADAALLDLLQANNASVDFFVAAEQITRSGATPATAAAAGHGAGIIASPIRALTSDGRDALFAEVSAARQVLSDAAAGSEAVRCLRLPAAASDGYTRAAAAELGYEVLQWDIDATGAAPDTLVAQLFPGAVMRLDGEDSAALAAALETLLPALAQQGYSVQSLCSQ